MNTMQITFENTALLNSAKRLFSNMKGVVSISVKREKKQDDTLMSEEEYFAMVDKRIADYESGKSKTIPLTPELRKSLFGE
ncbi:MAG: hypothetical protein LBG17_05025 [Bacteroidales bacterium]|jgi:hypothetical protein|nr:hypothetical protein [Bacteroidales bacterium]